MRLIVFGLPKTLQSLFAVPSPNHSLQIANIYNKNSGPSPKNCFSNQAKSKYLWFPFLLSIRATVKFSERSYSSIISMKLGSNSSERSNLNIIMCKKLYLVANWLRHNNSFGLLRLLRVLLLHWCQPYWRWGRGGQVWCSRDQSQPFWYRQGGGGQTQHCRDQFQTYQHQQWGQDQFCRDHLRSTTSSTRGQTQPCEANFFILRI